MTNTELDDSLIGPLSGSRIGDEPVKWGVRPDFEVADLATEEYVAREVERYKDYANRVLKGEIRVLLRALDGAAEPQGVLHGMIVWGPSTAPRIAGYLGRAVADVEMHLKALEFLGVIRPTEDMEFGDPCYAFDPNSEVFAE